jgi:hypothetical protein
MSYFNLPKNGEMIHILQQRNYFYNFFPSFFFMVQFFIITNLEKKLRFTTKHVHLFVVIFFPPNVLFHNNALRSGLEMFLLKDFT